MLDLQMELIKAVSSLIALNEKQKNNILEFLNWNSNLIIFLIILIIYYSLSSSSD
jgi:hypothetical protein